MSTLALAAALVYAAATLVAALAARRVRAASPAASIDAAEPFVSVLVAARNEERTLAPCLEALSAQTYPRERMEVIVADDHSTDATGTVARHYDVTYLRLPDGGPEGKAAALHAAYEVSKGDILLITDADCRPPSRWVEHMAVQFDDPQAGIVSGATTVEHRRAIDRMQTLDWALLLTVAAGISALGRPLTAMGNNMGVRRDAYEAVGGYPEIDASVTEDYALFQAVRRRTKYDVRLLVDEKLANRTLPVESLREMLRQRRRWARGGLRAGPRVHLFYAFVWAAHAIIPAALLASPLAGAAALALKITADAGALRLASNDLDLKGAWSGFPAFEVLLFTYVILMPVSLAAAPRLTWRGRTH